MSYQSKKTNAELKALVKQFNEGFRINTEMSRDAHIHTLPTGSKIPEEGKFYDNATRALFAGTCEQLRTKAREILDTQLQKIKTEAIESPADDAVNAIKLLSMRKNITEGEVDSLLQRYGDNVQAYKTIVDIAEDHGLHGWARHPIDAQMQDVEDLAGTLDRAFTVSNAEMGRASNGFCSVLDMQIDNVFSAE